MFEWNGSHAAAIRKRLAADFRDWESDNDKFDALFESVVKALRADEASRTDDDQEPAKATRSYRMRRRASVVLLIVALTCALMLFPAMWLRSAGGLNTGDVAFGIEGTVVLGMLVMIAISLWRPDDMAE